MMDGGVVKYFDDQSKQHRPGQGQQQPASENVGKRTLTEDYHARNAAQTRTVLNTAAPVPGRTTLPTLQLGQGPDQGVATGNSYADQGTACDATSGARRGCFLKPGQRGRIISEYQQRVLAAQMRYMDALGELRTDELLKKTKEKEDWVFDLLVDVIGAVTISSVSSALKYIANSGKETLSSVVENVDSAVGEIESEPLPEKGIEIGVNSSISAGKAALPKPSPDDNGKAASLDFIEIMKDSSAVTYQNLRENLLAGISDAMLLVVWQAFDARFHSTSEYKRQVSDKLKRFKDTGAERLGVKDPDIYNSEDADYTIIGHEHQIETRAFWVQLPHGKRLALYRRAGDPAPQVGDYVYPEFQDVRKGLKPGEWTFGNVWTKEAVETYKKNDLIDHPFHFYKIVPKEFQEAVVKMHEATWHEPPGKHEAGFGEMVASVSSPR